MAIQFSFIDEDGYIVSFETVNGRGVLVARSESGTEVAAYLNDDAAEQLASALTAWAARR